MGKKFWTDKDPRAAAFRSSAAWRNLAARFLQLHPLCRICMIRPAVCVHHIVPLAKMGADLETRGLDPENLAALCDECHEKVHEAMRRGFDAAQLFRSC